MPLKQLRVCGHCNGQVRWAPCSKTCQVPFEGDKDSWLPNMQQGAGTMERAPQ